MSCNLDKGVLKEARRKDDQIVWIRQSLTGYVQKEIIQHLEREGITDFSHKIGINSGRIQAFLKGAGSFRLDTCDRILNYIDNYNT